MKTSRFTNAQILAILKKCEEDVPVADLCRQHGISSSAYFNWRTKFVGMQASLMGEMKAVAAENRRLKKSEPLSTIGPRTMASAELAM
jgi:putative transposase